MSPTKSVHTLFETGGSYSKVEIGLTSNEPKLTNQTKFSPGLYRCKNSNTIVLFVDLDKTDKPAEHKFNDYFDGENFHWDSQPQQNINTPTIQSIVNQHNDVILFARIHKSIRGVTQSFVYCGRLDYLTYDPATSKPVHITFYSRDYRPGKTVELDDIYYWSSTQGLKLARPLVKVKTSRISDDLIAPSVVSPKIFEPELSTIGVSKEADLTPSERQGVAKQRLTQGEFRSKLLLRHRNRCALTGLSNEDLLIASHIKAWAESDEFERRDVNNGLLLCSPIDSLFDKHYISFFNDGTIVISSSLGRKAQAVFGITKGMKLIDPPNAETQKYLSHHRSSLKK